MDNIISTVRNTIQQQDNLRAKDIFKDFIKEDCYVGELFSLNYQTADILVHNRFKNQVGGIPALSFLIATRLTPNFLNSEQFDFNDEDSSIILLRVMDSIPLPQDLEATRIRIESAQNISGDINKYWDSESAMDLQTKNFLSYAGLRCRVIGTFYLTKNSESDTIRLDFGTDISNYYPNYDLKIYKPTEKALDRIVNYSTSLENNSKVKIGTVRYASTNRQYQQLNVGDVSVYMDPNDLVNQKTALFGMTRTGKSNTTKIIAKSVYELRYSKQGQRIGQIIFDPNGEYANDNEQDNNSCLKNIWELANNAQKNEEVVTYGITKHPNDVDRKLMLMNFYSRENLATGKEIINRELIKSGATYVKGFISVSMEVSDDLPPNELVRFLRKLLAYKSILAKAGFTPPANERSGHLRFKNLSLFSKELCQLMSKTEDYKTAAETLSQAEATWAEIANAMISLREFIEKSKDYKVFNENYTKNHGHSWADQDFVNLIDIFKYRNGTKMISNANRFHNADIKMDYVKSIYDDLSKGKLVIIDQSTGDPILNSFSAERVITEIFKSNQERFINGKNIPSILVYLEEAHNLLPSSSEGDLMNIWVRTAKEGAKYKIGMVYATQEVSSIQKNILKNTSNWFISHLNNTDETKELRKFYDFADFEQSILKAQDKGFLRVKTLSRNYIIPVQVDKFEIKQTLINKE
ncbi:ATP-binding protein [Succinivibrio dextrinosolvens]|uniref:ATP-binding protein n=1 Tax=Succinivibrio dextrinosolvens TaxID=83771 RepID=UPI00192465F3|nr:DUF87 domain-containing protein [Succinivibrio dextrinosolvens]